MTTEETNEQPEEQKIEQPPEENWKEKYLLTLAEMENMRKRMQKERYDDAAKVYQWQVMAEDLSREKQLEAAQAYWELKKKTGDKEAALWGAKQIIRLAKDHPEAVAKAYLFEAEYFAAENNMQEL